MCAASRGRIFWPIFAVVYITALVWGCQGEGSDPTQAPRVREEVQEGGAERAPGPYPELDDQHLEPRNTVGEVRPPEASYPEALY